MNRALHVIVGLGLAWCFVGLLVAVRTARTPRRERKSAYAGFHDAPLTIPGWCGECTAHRDVRVHPDGSYSCRTGHRTPAGGDR